MLRHDVKISCLDEKVKIQTIFQLSYERNTRNVESQTMLRHNVKISCLDEKVKIQTIFQLLYERNTRNVENQTKSRVDPEKIGFSKSWKNGYLPTQKSIRYVEESEKWLIFPLKRISISDH